MRYVFFSAAEAGALPNVVGEEELTTGISAQQGTGSVGAVVAPPLGGALFGAFCGLPFLTDAISYLMSAGAVKSVRTRFDRSDGSRPATSIRQDAIEGLRWMWRHTAIRSIAVIAAGLQVAISGVTLVVIVAARVTGASSLITGLLLAAVGIGGVGGALLTPMVKRRWGFGPMLLAVIWAQAGLWVLFAISPGLIFTGVVLALFAASMPMFGIASHSYLLAATPDRLRGRVTTSFGLLTWGVAVM